MLYRLKSWDPDRRQIIYDKPIRPRPKGNRLLVIRYGGIGDMIQASTVMHYYQKHNWQVTVNCHPIGAEILENDINVDHLLVQERDQVPTNELGEYWKALAKPYDKVINLTESVESYLIANDRMTPSHWWNQAARHRLYNVNYLEMTHLIAEIPPEVPYEARFAASARDCHDAREYRKKLLKKGEPPIIMWTLSGSSVHKAWPYLDEICARILLTWPKARIIFTGDKLTQILEAGWEKEPRIIKKCGRLGIRPTLSLAKYGVDLVIGPETGVMNAVGLEDVAKIVTLSHSSRENLTKHWVNATSLTPTQHDCPCSPCHILHHSFASCHQGPVTGTALCQETISADTMWDVINYWAGYLEWSEPIDHQRLGQLQRIS